MGTIVFDFDSTLISDESLELILQQQLIETPEKYQQLKQLTDQGMAGKISFASSLKKRLALAAPTQQQIQDFVVHATTLLTPGMRELITRLKQRHAVWVISGGLQEVLEALCRPLGIEPTHIHGVKLQWSHQGDYIGINQNDAFSESKVAGAITLSQHWDKPSVVIGDGMTDFALYAQGLCDHFIAYTQHITRPDVIAKAKHTANSVHALKNILSELLF